ncbi:hypothetical protein QJQ45_021055 [Haematococcus lacustris]|nr:hypothetical protein QJQ45_021055 [Haematococcus lacustris]
MGPRRLPPLRAQRGEVRSQASDGSGSSIVTMRKAGRRSPKGVHAASLLALLLLLLLGRMSSDEESIAEPQHQQHQHQARRSRRSGQSSCWANATSVAAAADVEDGLRSQRPTQLAQCPPKAHDVMAAAVGEAVLAAAAMVAAAEAAQQE